jgi:hypothetical protein
MRRGVISTLFGRRDAISVVAAMLPRKMICCKNPFLHAWSISIVLREEPLRRTVQHWGRGPGMSLRRLSGRVPAAAIMMSLGLRRLSVNVPPRPPVSELGQIVRRLDSLEARGMLGAEAAEQLRRAALGPDIRDALLVLHCAYPTEGDGDPAAGDTIFGQRALELTDIDSSEVIGDTVGDLVGEVLENFVGEEAAHKIGDLVGDGVELIGHKVEDVVEDADEPQGEKELKTQGKP